MLDRQLQQSLSQLPPWEPHPYHVLPILTLVVEGFPKTFFTYLLNFSSTIELNCGVFYVAGVPEHNILIDAGASRHGFESAGFYCREEAPFVETVQMNTGLTPKEMDVVLMTHLHGDHTENGHLFPDSAFYVQREEWEAVFNPPAAFRKTL